MNAKNTATGKTVDTDGSLGPIDVQADEARACKQEHGVSDVARINNGCNENRKELYPENTMPDQGGMNLDRSGKALEENAREVLSFARRVTANNENSTNVDYLDSDYDPVEDTRMVWSSRLGTMLTRDEAQQIITNFTRFCNLLTKFEAEP